MFLLLLFNSAEVVVVFVQSGLQAISPEWEGNQDALRPTCFPDSKIKKIVN